MRLIPRRRPAALLTSLAVATAAVSLTALGAPAADGSVTVAQPAAAKADAASKATSAKFERWATITKISNGLYYDAGQQNTALTVTYANGKLKYTDRRTDVLRSKPRSCDRKPSRVGLVVVCKVPDGVSKRHPMTVKVFTRLGNDSVNTSALPAKFKLYMLCDKGRDTVVGGAGNDFINGAQNKDVLRGGAGNDWIRGNLGRDLIWGGPGNDRLVGVNGNDGIRGGIRQRPRGWRPGQRLAALGRGPRLRPLR